MLSVISLLLCIQRCKKTGALSVLFLKKVVLDTDGMTDRLRARFVHSDATGSNHTVASTCRTPRYTFDLAALAHLHPVFPPARSRVTTGQVSAHKRGYQVREHLNLRVPCIPMVAILSPLDIGCPFSSATYSIY